MSKILIAYSTTDGHTRRICERIAAVLTGQDHDVKLDQLGGGNEPDPHGFDKIVVGASIRYGRHRPAVFDFVTANRQLLENKRTAFFSVNLVARKPEKSQPDTNPYLRKFLRKLSWQPDRLAVFAGKIDYPKYDFRDRQIIRLIMWITHGPTRPGTVLDFTDWDSVDEFGRSIATM